MMMREELRKQCEIFLENRDVVKETFKWEISLLFPVCASVFTNKGQVATKEKLQECSEMVKKDAGIFSEFRGNAKLAVISMLATEENPNEIWSVTQRYYKKLREQFQPSPYLAVAAVVLAQNVEENEAEQYIIRGKKLYEMMKKNHPFLTYKEDSIFAILLGMSNDTNDDAVMERVEKAYHYLKGHFSSSNDVQSLSHCLSIVSGNVDERCNKVVRVFDMLKNAGVKYGQRYELASLGALTLIPIEENCIVEDIIAVDTFLSDKKGYKGLCRESKKNRLMHASMIVTSAYCNSDTANVAAITATLAMIAAQEAAMCAIMASTVAASAASN